MKSKLFLTVLFFILSTTIWSQDYDRSSLSIFFVQYSDQMPFSTSMLSDSYFPQKFDKNDIGFNTINLNKTFSSSSGSEKEITDQIYNQRIPNKILKSILVDENLGYMTFKKLQERGLYNAKDADVVIANNTERRMDDVKDAGKYLLNKIFFLVIEPISIEEKKEDKLDKIAKIVLYKYTFKATLYKIDIDYNTLFSDFWFDRPDNQKMDKLMNYQFRIKAISSNTYTVANTNMDGMTKANRLLQLINGSITVDNTNGSKNMNSLTSSKSSSSNSSSNTDIGASNKKAASTKKSSSISASDKKSTSGSSSSSTNSTTTTTKPITVEETKERVKKEKEKEVVSDATMGAAALGVIGIASGMNDSYSGNSCFGKFNLGLGWESIPLIANDDNNNTTSTESSSHPIIIAGFKFGFFNNHGISLHVTPTLSWGLNVLSPGTTGSHLTYGSDAILLIGRKPESHFKLFTQYGMYNRSGSWTYDEDAANSSTSLDLPITNVVKNADYNYSLVRTGLGIIYQKINEGQETYYKPGILFENVSNNSTSSTALVYNLQMLFSSYLIVDLSYCSNYPNGGKATHSTMRNQQYDGQSFFSIRLVKTGKLF